MTIQDKLRVKTVEKAVLTALSEFEGEENDITPHHVLVALNGLATEISSMLLIESKAAE